MRFHHFSLNHVILAVSPGPSAIAGCRDINKNISGNINVRLSPLDRSHDLQMEGCLQWIGLRPARQAPLVCVNQARIDAITGLEGDHFSGKTNRKRQITLIQAEHLSVIAALLGRPAAPEQLRRNLVVGGLNLLSLKGHPFKVGEAILRITGPCHPCSRMEAALGQGGFQAMRGHGGLTAEVLRGGCIEVGDPVRGIQNDLFMETGPSRGTP